MSKYIKMTIIFLIAALLSWGLALFVPSSTWMVCLFLLAVVCFILFLCFLAIVICKKAKKDISPYRLFAIADGVIGVCVLVYALYDIATDTGWFAGLAGVLLLVYVIPMFPVLLLGDFLLWKFKKTREKE